MLGRWLASGPCVHQPHEVPIDNPDLVNSAVAANRTPVPEVAIESLIRTIQVNTPESSQGLERRSGSSVRRLRTGVGRDELAT